MIDYNVHYKTSMRAARSVVMTALTTVACGCASRTVHVEPVYYPKPPASPHVVHLVSFSRLHDLVPPEPSWMDAFNGGPISPFVETPAGIAYRNGHLYICDVSRSSVRDWDLASGRERVFGYRGDLPLRQPVDVAVSGSGDVYVADTGLQAVVVYRGGANDAPTALAAPSDADHRPVAVAAGGDHVYVADAATHQVHVYNAANGAFLESFGGPGADPGLLYYPLGVVSDVAGNIYVADMMNARVQVFSPAFAALRSMGGAGDRYGDMGKPKKVDIAPDGVIFVADAEFAHVHVFDSAGRLLMLFGGPGDSAGDTPMPTGIVVAHHVPPNVAALVPGGFNADYFVFVADSIGTNRVSLFAVGQGS